MEEKHLGLYFEIYRSIWPSELFYLGDTSPSILLTFVRRPSYTYKSGFPNILWVPETCHSGDGCFDILVPQRVDERGKDSRDHIAHDVEVEGQVGPVGHIGDGNG